MIIFVMGGIETDKGLQLCGWQAWWNLLTSWSMRKPISNRDQPLYFAHSKHIFLKPSLTNTHTQTHRETQKHTYTPTNTHIHTNTCTHISGYFFLFNIEALIGVFLLFVTDCNYTEQADLKLWSFKLSFLDKD